MFTWCTIIQENKTFEWNTQECLFLYRKIFQNKDACVHKHTAINWETLTETIKNSIINLSIVEGKTLMKLMPFINKQKGKEIEASLLHFYVEHLFSNIILHTLSQLFKPETNIKLLCIYLPNPSAAFGMRHKVNFLSKSNSGLSSVLLLLAQLSYRHN